MIHDVDDFRYYLNGPKQVHSDEFNIFLNEILDTPDKYAEAQFIMSFLDDVPVPEFPYELKRLPIIFNEEKLLFIKVKSFSKEMASYLLFWMVEPCKGDYAKFMLCSTSAYTKVARILSVIGGRNEFWDSYKA